MQNLWGPQEVAEFFSVPVQTIYQWRHRGYGPAARRVGKHLRYKPDEVVAWFEGQVA